MIEALNRRPWWKKAPEGKVYNFWWGPNGERFSFSGMTPGLRQLVNRIPQHGEFCTKTQLALNLQSYAKRSGGVDVSSIVPTTIVLSSGGTSGLAQLKSYQATLSKAIQGSEDTNQHLHGDFWIVKPGSRNRGMGIEVMQGQKAVEDFIRSKATSSQWVVQKYLEDPMLIHGCKFDIRQLILLTHDLEVYMYSESYVRTCATEYTKDSTDRTVHLTNDYVQKHMDNYGKFEDANKLSYDEFRAVIASHGKNFDTDIYPQIEEATRHVFRSVLGKLNVRHTDYCFELLGMDFMVDSSFKVWLIEINTSPALFRHGKVLEDLMPPMIEEVAQRVVDKVFPPPPDAVLPETLNGFKRLYLQPKEL